MIAEIAPYFKILLIRKFDIGMGLQLAAPIDSSTNISRKPDMGMGLIPEVFLQSWLKHKQLLLLCIASAESLDVYYIMNKSVY